MVYDDAEKLYAEVRKDGHDMLEEAFSVLFPDSVSLTETFHYPWTSTKRPSFASSGKLIAFNPTFLPRREVVRVPMSASTQSLKSKVIQTSQDGKTGYALMESASTGIAESLAFNAECMPVSGKLSFSMVLACKTDMPQSTTTWRRSFRVEER